MAKQNKVFTAKRKQVNFDFEVNGKNETFTYTAPSTKESMEAMKAFSEDRQAEGFISMLKAFERNISHDDPSVKAAFIDAIYDADANDFIEWANELVQAEGVKK